MNRTPESRFARLSGVGSVNGHEALESVPYPAAIAGNGALSGPSVPSKHP